MPPLFLLQITLLIYSAGYNSGSLDASDKLLNTAKIYAEQLHRTIVKNTKKINQ
jgi:hypothetical protein